MLPVNQTKTQRFFLIFLLGLLNAITPISIDMYLPAFPAIAHDLDTTSANIALSVSSYFLGFAIGQIIYGPLLDRFGRKRPLYIGLCLYVFATIGCATAHAFPFFLMVRFVQAIGGCVSSVAVMAMVFDFFPKQESARIISFLMLVLSVSPMLAPTIGGFIITVSSWHFVFYLLAAIALLMIVAVIFLLPEGHGADKAVSLKPKDILNGFADILVHPEFYVFALAGTFSFAGLFVYVAGSPSVFMDYFRVSPKIYGAIFALLSVGFIGGSQLNHLLTRKFTNKQVFKNVLFIQAVASLFFLIGSLNGWYRLAATITWLFIVLSCAGITYPNAAAIALSPFTKNTGSASALLGFIQIGIGGLISSGIGFLKMKGSLPIAGIMFISVMIALTILLMGRRKALGHTHT